MRERVKIYTEELADLSNTGLGKTKFMHAIKLFYILTSYTKLNLN